MAANTVKNKPNTIVATVCSRCESLVSENKAYFDPEEFAALAKDDPENYYPNIASDTKAIIPYRHSIEVHGCMKC